MKDITEIQLLAIDLDGTTLRNDASLSSNVKKALEYAIQQDIFVVPCTGRALGSLSPEVTAIHGITYAVTSNGAAIENLSLGQRIYCNLLDRVSPPKPVFLLLQRSHCEIPAEILPQKLPDQEAPAPLKAWQQQM